MSEYLSTVNSLPFYLIVAAVLTFVVVMCVIFPYPRNQETKMLPRFTELKNYIWQNVYKEYLEVQK